MSFRRSFWTWIAGGSAVLLLLIIPALPAPMWSVAGPWFERLEKVTQVLTPLILLVGVVAAFRRIKAAEDQARAALRQAHTAEHGQITERFTRAIQQLGNEESLAIRLGGIYALERIANDSKEDYWPVIEVLCAYLRESKEAPAEDDEKRPVYPTDLQAILTVLSRRKRQLDKGAIDLSKANLRGANFFQANLSGARLFGSNLSQASLIGANLSGADLTCANLSEASLHMADLSKADFLGADLKGAKVGLLTDLRGTKLKVARNVTQEQIDSAKVSRATELPAGLKRAKR